MRTLLILALLAAVGLPLHAQAQPVGDDGNPTEVSGLAVEARKAAECPTRMPEDSRRFTKLLDAPSDTKNKKTEENPGTRSLIPMLIAGYGNNNIDYRHIHPGLAKLVREQLPRTKLFVECQGDFKGIKFLHVSQEGWDDFEVDFSNGIVEWAVKPFNSHQMTEGMFLRPFYPQPATRPFEDWLKSIERGRPNYADLTPDAASKLQAQWPALQSSLKDWGRLKGFRFVRQDHDGAYIYLAAYEHRQVVWTALPANAGGKFTVLTYDEKAG